MKLIPGTSQSLKICMLYVSLTAAAFNVSAQPAPKPEAKAPGNAVEGQRFQERFREVQERAQKEALKVLRVEIEKGVRELQKDFPKQPEIAEILFSIAGEAEPEKAKQLCKEVIDGHAPDELKQAAKGLLKRLEAVGKPLDMKFTALDGSAVDLSKMKGKVVLIDFWATWCGPCVAELPNVQAAYNKFHSKGFEIIGISLDHKKDALERFIAEKKLPWPQFWDDQGEKFAKEYGISGIPMMWLVDKNGVLRDPLARENLVQKIETLLAEK